MNTDLFGESQFERGRGTGTFKPVREHSTVGTVRGFSHGNQLTAGEGPATSFGDLPLSTTVKILRSVQQICVRAVLSTIGGRASTHVSKELLSGFQSSGKSERLSRMIRIMGRDHLEQVGKGGKRGKGRVAKVALSAPPLKLREHQSQLELSA